VLSPVEISEIAEIDATESHCIGDSKGVVRKGIYETNYWCLSLKLRGEEEEGEQTHWFSDGLIRLLSQLPENFVHKLKARDPEIGANLWVGLYDIQNQGAFNIRSDVSKLLGERELELIFDLYVDHSVFRDP
jgi:hypothetical protein